jgi:hypothetical protein
MALTLGPGATGDKLAAKQDAGTDVIYEISGDDRTISGATDAYGTLAQGALSNSATALLGPASGHDYIVDNITLANPGASTRVVTFYKTKNSTTYDATTQWGPAITLLAGESAQWHGGSGWTVYTSTGLVKVQPSGIVIPATGFGGPVTGFASDTYLVGSKILLPTSLLVAGQTMFRWNFGVSKTAACTGTPTVIIRYGTAGAIGDTARVTFTFSAQTAAVDRGWFEIIARFRAVGGSAVLDAEAFLSHQLATTGLNNTTTGGQELAVSSGSFDSTPANSYIGLSVNGTSTTAPAVWTITTVYGFAVL